VHIQYLDPPDSEIIPWEWMGEVKRRPLGEMDGVVNTMGQNEVGGEMDIIFGDADLVDCVWELVLNTSDACTSADSDSTSKGWKSSLLQRSERDTDDMVLRM